MKRKTLALGVNVTVFLTDVVIGAPYEGSNSTGAVYVYYGSKYGIEAQYRQVKAC